MYSDSLSKKSYYHEPFKNSLNDMRKTWQAINALLNGRKRRRLKLINKLKDPEINNSIVNDPSHIPNIISKYFSCVGNNLATKMPQAGHSFMD